MVFKWHYFEYQAQEEFYVNISSSTFRLNISKSGKEKE